MLHLHSIAASLLWPSVPSSLLNALHLWHQLLPFLFLLLLPLLCALHLLWLLLPCMPLRRGSGLPNSFLAALAAADRFCGGLRGAATRSRPALTGALATGLWLLLVGPLSQLLQQLLQRYHTLHKNIAVLLRPVDCILYVLARISPLPKCRSKQVHLHRATPSQALLHMQVVADAAPTVLP